MIAGNTVNKMQFPWSYKKLHQLFLDASDPDIDDVQGEFIVDMLSFLPSMKWLSHRKIITHDGSRHCGHNTLPGFTWGRFALTGKTFKKWGSVKTVMFNYDPGKNFFLLKNIRDYIRCIEEKKLYIGKFYYQFFGYPLLIGYFSLEKIK